APTSVRATRRLSYAHIGSHSMRKVRLRRLICGSLRGARRWEGHGHAKRRFRRFLARVRTGAFPSPEPEAPYDWDEPRARMPGGRHFQEARFAPAPRADRRLRIRVVRPLLRGKEHA